MPLLSILTTSHIYKITTAKRAKCARGLERYTYALSRVWSFMRTGARMHRKKVPPVMTLQSYFAGLLVTGCFTFVPLTRANGASGGHMSAVGSHEHGQCNERAHYSDPFWGSSFPYPASSYNSYYLYTPTPEQQAGAKQQVEAYLIAVKKRRNMLRPIAISP
jgi:hypothetical protein